MTFSEEIITPEMAREYLKANKINRPLRDSTVDYYASMMKQGKWMMNGEAICFLKGGSLGNGQHRLAAIIKANIPVKFLVVRGCDDQSFTTYDSGRNRDISDVMSMSGIQNSTWISAIISRYFILSSDMYGDGCRGGAMKYLKKSKQDYIDEYNDTPALYQDAALFSKKMCSKIRLLKQSEVGGIYIYLEKKRFHKIDVVRNFLEELHSMSTTIPSIQLLREKLIADRLASSSMKGGYKYNIIAKAWNAFLSEKPIKILRWSPSEGRIFFK